LLQQIYPQQDSDALSARVIETFWPHGSAPAAESRTADNSRWSQDDAILISYGDSLLDGRHNPLDLLHDFLATQLPGVINGIHILPFFPYTSDDGFSVSDYEKVNSSLGSWADIRRIAGEFTLMSDLVLNHVSSQSKWFNGYRQRHTPYNDYFFEASPEDDLSATVRPRSTPLLQAIETADGIRHVWCTFSHDQIDLDFRNPEVLIEIIRIIRLHVDNGVRILRLDAVAFIWKEPGTPSIHLPQTHAIVKLLRVLADYAAEEIILITETNVPKAENLSYFGAGDEAHMIYNFPLPPLILHGLQAGTARYLNRWQMTMPPAPMGCSYFNFTASHDGIGMRPAEGLLPEPEIANMVTTVTDAGGRASMRTLEDGSEAIYELNCTYFDALSRTFDGPDEHHINRFLTSQTIVMSLEGIPAFYIHSLLATGNDQQAVKKRKINRAINRHRWDYPTLRAMLANTDTPTARVLAALSERLRLRARQPAFHPNATQFTLRLDERVFGIWRQSLDRSQSVFALHNLSRANVQIALDDLNLIADEDWIDILSGERLSASQTEISLGPYQCRWITNRY
jgi:sucrose phosphorylase